MTELVCRADIVAAARSLLGLPWRHQARAPGIAVDCLGVIGSVAAAVRVPGWEAWNSDPVLCTYGPDPRPDILLQTCKKYLDQIPISRAAPGDILLMSFHTFPRHFGIVTVTYPSCRIVHSYASVKRVVETSPAIANARVMRAYSFRGVEPWQP